MSVELNETHDAARQSWVASANGHHSFPLQNLPFGVFCPPGEAPRGGVAIGNQIFDLKRTLEAGLFTGTAEQAARAASGETLNPLMALGRAARIELRRRLCELLAADTRDGREAQKHASGLVHEACDCTLRLPAAVGSYTDFFAGIHHATNAGVRMKREPPLLPNYKYVPVAYHGRASSVIVAGTALRRPSGQRKAPEDAEPTFGPSRKLDMELELGVWVGPGNTLGEPIPISRAAEHIVGLGLLNDWSARDIQSWEYVPLGPFLAKNFGTTVSPWIVTMEALAPFRKPQPPRPQGDPKPLPYLWDDADQESGAFDIALEALIGTDAMRSQGLPPQRLSSSNVKHLYWTLAQLLAHHTCTGCNLQPGDLFGSGTLSAPERSGWGSLWELTEDGAARIALPTGETRAYIEDGDEVILRARAEREGFAPIGFGDCAGKIIPAR
ncbi:MAG: fumarylacetoacetase [Burkholderiales bacterium]